MSWEVEAGGGFGTNREVGVEVRRGLVRPDKSERIESMLA